MCCVPALSAKPGASIGHTVISVPGQFFTAARTALLSAADDAGLTDVSLISDSVAAVIQQTADAHTGTYLVYGMGYGGCEFGLVRAVRGTYRVLGYEGAAAPGGEALDALILGSWLTALRQHGVTSDEMSTGSADWLRLRRLAEQVKLRLTVGEPVLFPRAVQTPDGDRHVQFDSASFNLHVQAMVTGTFDRMAALRTRAELGEDGIDLVTLVGGKHRHARAAGGGRRTRPSGGQHRGRPPGPWRASVCPPTRPAPGLRLRRAPAGREVPQDRPGSPDRRTDRDGTDRPRTYRRRPGKVHIGQRPPVDPRRPPGHSPRPIARADHPGAGPAGRDRHGRQACQRCGGARPN